MTTVGGGMTMRVISTLAAALAIATPAFAQQQQQIPAPTLFSIRGGETLPLRAFASVTPDCVSTFAHVDGIDILDGPPEITMKFELGQVSVNSVAGKACTSVAGGTIVITAAKDFKEQQEADLTFRVRYKTKHSNSSTWTGRYHLLMYPASEQASKQGDPRTVRAHAEGLATRASERFDGLQRDCDKSDPRQSLDGQCASNAVARACQKRHPGDTCKIIDPPETLAADARRVEEREGAEPEQPAKTEPTRAISVPTPTDTSSSGQPPDTSDTSMLARELKIELKRVGCDAGDVDGVWGDQAKTALSEFTRIAKVALPSDEPSSGALQAVHNEKGPICLDAPETGDEPKRRIANRPKTPRRISGRGASELPRPSWGFCRGSVHYTDQGYSCR